ncbi:hypothetical protein pdam_00003818, partial [Pocillopora damicornis]
MTSKWYCLFLQFLYFLKTYGKPVQLKSTLLWNCPTKRKGISLCTIPQDHNKDFASVQRRAKDGNLQAVTYPSIVLMYNKYIGRLVRRGVEHPLNSLRPDLWKDIFLLIFLATKVGRDLKGGA